MYIPAYIGTTATWNWVERLTKHIADVLQVLRQLFSELLERLCSALGIILPCLSKIFAQPSEWIREVFFTTVDLVHTHIYLAHILAWSIFFGPIVVLVPFLLVHEILIITIYNFTYALHGLLPGSLIEKYEALRLSLLDTRESLFSFVDRSSSVFNKWTSEHLPLMVLRLAGGVLGTVLLYAIWTGW